MHTRVEMLGTLFPGLGGAAVGLEAAVDARPGPQPVFAAGDGDAQG
ncbi:hypothetical protein ACFXPI_01530 [Streptomyces sp. NPDC059104]